jgi:hypothetical protein
MGFNTMGNETYKCLMGWPWLTQCQGYFICFDVSDESEASLKEAHRCLRDIGEVEAMGCRNGEVSSSFTMFY